MRMDYLNGIHKLSGIDFWPKGNLILITYVQYADQSASRFSWFSNASRLKTSRHQQNVFYYIRCACFKCQCHITSINVEQRSGRVNIFWHSKRSKVSQLYRTAKSLKEFLFETGHIGVSPGHFLVTYYIVFDSRCAKMRCSADICLACVLIVILLSKCW